MHVHRENLEDSEIFQKLWFLIAWNLDKLYLLRLISPPLTSCALAFSLEL